MLSEVHLIVPSSFRYLGRPDLGLMLKPHKNGSSTGRLLPIPLVEVGGAFSYTAGKAFVLIIFRLAKDRKMKALL